MSDTHRKHLDLTETLQHGGDLLIHCGDCECTDEKSTYAFLKWCTKISRNYTHGMVLTFGNHDTYAQDYESDVRDELFGSHVNLLLSESMTINDIQIHANPYSHAYGYNFHAYTIPETYINFFDSIPANIDILVTHSPPKGILDSGHGSQSLRNAIERIKPRLHIFGHIHHGFGFEIIDSSTFVNCSVISGTSGLNAPTLIDYNENQKVIRSITQAKL